MTYIKRGLDPFDILVRNMFQANASFAPAQEAKISHPLDIYEEADGLHFEVACTGLTKSDIEISVEGDVLKISYDNKGDEPVRNYIHKGIAKRSFNLAYKIATKFDLSSADAQMKNGLLTIIIPFAEEAKPKALKIK
jgi:HSP20 family protein